MKKIWILAAVAALLMTITACGAGDVGGVSSEAGSSQGEESSAPSVLQSDVEDNLQGLETYLVGNELISGEPQEMRADVIGAKSGVRYQFSYNGKNNVTVELYEYEPDNVNDTAQEVLDSVKSSGEFSLLGQQIPAILSDNGKYLMIYKDTVDDDENKAYADTITKEFKAFKNS
ncbi:MAG: Lipoprotein [Oscillospiraceae bacterium]|jgi:hypothetical protein